MSLLRGGFHDLLHPPKGNVAVLDVLRSAAILLVFTGHYVGEFHASPRIARLPIFVWGWTGVDLFFVLSGLLIGTQLAKEMNRTGTIRIRRFLLRRGLRIWPLYFSVVIFVAAESFFGRNNSGIWSDACFLSNYFHCQIGGGWSLSTEEQFYILIPVLLSLFLLKLRPRLMWIVPALGIMFLVAARATTIHYSTLPEAALRQKLYSPIHTHADGLAVGVFLAWLAVFHADRLRSGRFALAVSTAMLVAGVGLYACSRLLFNYTALGLIYGAFALYGISGLPVPGPLRWRGFYVVSRLSYGLYLNHFGILSRLYPALLGWRTRALGLGICYLISLAVCIGVATITFQFIEWPFLRLRARWIDRERASADTAIPATRKPPVLTSEEKRGEVTLPVLLIHSDAREQNHSNATRSIGGAEEGRTAGSGST